MSIVKEKNSLDYLGEVDFNPAEDDLIIGRRKAKVGVICLDQDGRAGVLVATRSVHETSRIDQPDWIGGRLKIGEKPRRGLERERSFEFPGIALANVIKIRKAKERDGIMQTLTHIYLGNAITTEGIPIVPGLNEDGVQEHSALSIVPLESFRTLEGMPHKYKKALFSQAGQIAVAQLVETAQPLIIPPDLQETRW